MFKNMKLAVQLGSLAGLLLILMIGVAGFGLTKISNIGHEIEAIAERDMPLTEMAVEIEVRQLDQTIWFERALRFGSVMAASEEARHQFELAEQKFEALGTKIDEKIKNGEAMLEEALVQVGSAEQRSEFEEVGKELALIDKEHAEFERHGMEAFELLGQGNHHEAMLLVEDIEVAEKELAEGLENIVSRIERFTDSALSTVEEDEKTAVTGMWSMTIVAIVLGVLFAVFLVRSITGPVQKMTETMGKLADGDLTVDIPETDSNNEIGRLLKAMKAMVDKLTEVIGEVRSAANNLASASEEVSATAQSMSQGNSEQAASVEETSSSVEQMSASINQNTENSKVTDGIASKAATEADEGGKAVRETVEAMNSIAEKISIIDDIAYQTNLLALNAAIEAARAGEHGKGFAVVAAEVRKLAERSQVAAQEISEVAGSSVGLAEKAGELLDEIVPSIKKTSDLVQEISAASEEQSSGVAQINNAMEQLNTVTQQSSSSSEELAATAEEMSSQAEQLQQLMEFFKVELEAKAVAAVKKTAEAKVTKIPEPEPKLAVVPSAGNQEFVNF